jgi:enamine deaminase RidA (YjgF/YER057c/UK114 family)
MVYDLPHNALPYTAIEVFRLMTAADSADIATPLSNYAPYRRAGDLVFFAGIISADPVAGKVVNGFADLPDGVRAELGETGEMSSDSRTGPILAQSWYVLDQLRKTVAVAGGTLDDVVNLVQYFTDLNDFPLYNQVRTKFFPNPPASTCVRVLELLPTPVTRLEVQAVAYIPERP